MSSSDSEFNSSSTSEGSNESDETRTFSEDPKFSPDLQEEEIVSHSRPGKEIRHVNQQMNIANADTLWYDHLFSHFSPTSESDLRTSWNIFSSHRIIIPTSQDRPYLAPKGCYTFFLHQLEAGLHFPLSEFLQELNSYYQVHLGQLTPNAFRSICFFVVLLRALDLPLDCITFSYFLVLAKSKEGPFYVISRSSRKLFDVAPSHVKDYKKHYFFIQPPKEWTCTTEWYPTFTKPTISKYFKEDKAYLRILNVLGDHCFSIPKLLSEDLLCYAELSPAKIKLKGKTGTRIMNAIFLRELEKKEKAGASSSAPKKQVTLAVANNTKGNCSAAEKKSTCSPTAAKKKAGSSSSIHRRVLSKNPPRKSDSSPPPQTTSPPHSSKKRTPTDPSPSVQQKGKRKLSAISITSASSQEVSGSDDEQPSGPVIHPLYTSESVIVGRCPTNIAQKLLFQLPSHADAAFLSSLGWSDLVRRTCSSITEGALYVGELVERVDVFKSNAYHDSHEGKNLRDQLQATIEEAKATHARELQESQARYEELLKKKEEELQQLTKDQTTELQKLKEELKASKAEAAQARKDLRDTEAQLVKKAFSFKEEFLKSKEFNEICGPKAFRYLEVGFEGTVNLFKAHGYPPAGTPTDFINLRDLLAGLPPDL